jgi:ADP-heptose:LPS heptosyltransferase
MAELDLIISVDTSCAHLAGGLGRPVLICLASAPEWRWMLERSDTPWYGRAQLFRQRRVGEWPALFQDVAASLEQFARERGRLSA